MITVITCGEIIEETKTVLIKTVPAKAALTKSTLTNFYILFDLF